MAEQPDKRRHLQRVPPHDLLTEENLLGAALLSQSAAAVVATDVDPGDFYRPANQFVADAIRVLVAENAHVDAGTVAAVLRHRGQLDQVKSDVGVGNVYLVHLTSVCSHTGGAPKWAELVVEYARKRRMLSIAAGLVDAVYAGDATSGFVAEMSKAADDDLLATTSSWEPVNLAAVLAGEATPTEPTFLARSDGALMLYPGKVHAFNGESESGKSWLALWACVERMRLGEHALYIDFESDEGEVIDRVLALGMAPKDLLERFHYIRPHESVNHGAVRLRIGEALRTWPITVAVVDGVGEALAVSGWKENDAPDVLAFMVMLPRFIARNGPAVILIDHVVKDREKQGNDARGSGAKRQGVDGAIYKIEMVKVFARGALGVSRVVITKDRPGWVRRVAANGRSVGELLLRSNDDGSVVDVEVRAPTDTSSDTPFRPTVLMERVSRAVEEANTAGVRPTSNAILATVRSKNRSHVRDAIRVLVEEGRLVVEPGPKNSQQHRCERPYRQVDDPRSDKFEDHDNGPEAQQEEIF